MSNLGFIPGCESMIVNHCNFILCIFACPKEVQDNKTPLYI